MEARSSIDNPECLKKVRKLLTKRQEQGIVDFWEELESKTFKGLITFKIQTSDKMVALNCMKAGCGAFTFK